MKTTHRNYAETEGDFNRISHFIMAHNAASRTCSTWCLGRFVDWRYAIFDNKLTTFDFWSNSAHLWFNGFGDLAGCAIAESGGGDFAILTHAGYRWLFEEMLAWCEANWSNRTSALTTEITSWQALEAEILERHEFQQTGAFTTAHFDLTAELLPRAPVPPGFTIVDMHACPDYSAQRLLRANAFRNKTAFTAEEMARELARDAYARSNPIYHAPTDLCVRAPDGTFAAGCEALIDSVNAEADIERVCTHTSYRRMGLARAVIQECLVRLKRMGLHRTCITGYSPEAIALYTGLGAQQRTESLLYTKR